MIITNISKYTKLIDSSKFSNIFGTCNHSYIKIDDKEYINFRITNYKYVSNSPFPVSNEYKYFSNNIICEIDKEYNIINYKILLDSKCNFKFNGEEDIRFFKLNNEYMFYSSKTDCNECVKNTGLNIFNLDKNLKCDKIVENLKYKFDWEKNWSYIEGSNGKFIYSFKPLTIISLNNDFEIKEDFVNAYINNNYRCSTNTLKFYDGYLTIVHFSEDGHYYHKFIYFDKNFNILKESKNFTFANKNIEFSCQIIDRDDDVDILFSLYDSLSYVSKFSKKVILDFIYDKIEDNSTEFNVNVKDLFDKNIFGYISLVTSSNDKEEIINLLKNSKNIIQLVNGNIIDLMVFRDRLIGGL